MAIQPIDLQTMYSQMSNVAQRVSHEQNGAQLSQSINQQSVINQNAEKAKSVQSLSNEESKAALVKDEGHGNGYSGASSKKQQSDEETSEEQKKDNEYRGDHMGQHINITR